MAREQRDKALGAAWLFGQRVKRAERFPSKGRIDSGLPWRGMQQKLPKIARLDGPFWLLCGCFPFLFSLCCDDRITSSSVLLLLLLLLARERSGSNGITVYLMRPGCQLWGSVPVLYSWSIKGDVRYHWALSWLVRSCRTCIALQVEEKHGVHANAARAFERFRPRFCVRNEPAAHVRTYT